MKRAKNGSSVDTERCPPKKRDTKAKHADSTVGKVSEKAGVSNRKAVQLKPARGPKITARQEGRHSRPELESKASGSIHASSRAKRTREYLTGDEMDKLLTAAKTASRNPVRDYCALLLMFRHGLRVSELCSIKLSDINVQTKEFHVERSKDGDSGPHDLYNGESAAIKSWLIERAKMAPPKECDTLFISERRKPISRVTIWVMIGLVAKAAGLEHLSVHPHQLRHSCGYALVNKGTDIRIIQGYLGHKAISSTVRYTKLDSRRFANLF